MAKPRSSKMRRPAPRPRPAPRSATTSTDAVPRASAEPTVGAVADDKWAENYPYVRGDLARIAVLAIILFAAIFIAPRVF